MDENDFIEIKVKLNGEHQEFRCTALATSKDEAVVRYVLLKEWKVGSLVLPAGTVSLGYFWNNRPYNAYHWIAPDGKSLGLYLNISDSTHITAGQVIWRDLVVDVLFTPDGQCVVLDKNELAGVLDVVLRKQIEQIREQILGSHEKIFREIESRSSVLLNSHLYD